MYAWQIMCCLHFTKCTCGDTSPIKLGVPMVQSGKSLTSMCIVSVSQSLILLLFYSDIVVHQMYSFRPNSIMLLLYT